MKDQRIDSSCLCAVGEGPSALRMQEGAWGDDNWEESDILGFLEEIDYGLEGTGNASRQRGWDYGDKRSWRQGSS